MLPLLAFTTVAFAQVQWVKDASKETIPSGPITGQINGLSVSFATGRIGKSGGMALRSPDAAFDHITVDLQDAETAFASKFSMQITLTVRKGELPDGKTFRRVLASLPDEQANLKGPGYSVPELYSLRMESRRGKEPGSGFDILSSGVYQPFTGRIELDNRKGDRLVARLYVCFNDKLKSCVAGSAELSVRDQK